MSVETESRVSKANSEVVLDHGSRDPHEEIFACESKKSKTDAINEVYRSLLGPRAEMLDQIVVDLYNDDARLDQLRKDLPDAFVKSAEGDGGPSALSMAMKNSVSDSLKIIAKTDKELLGNVISPVIGSASSKYFSDVIREMSNQFNRQMRLFFSPKTLLWFLQSLFSKKSFAQIIGEHTAGYRVESLYVVDLETLDPMALCDVDEDILSLSIVRDHKTEDFREIETYLESSRQGTKRIKNLSVPLGDHRNAVILEGSSHYLFAIVHGTMAADLLDILQDVCDEIDSRYGQKLWDIRELEIPTEDKIEEAIEGIHEVLKEGLVSHNVAATDKNVSFSKPIYITIFLALAALVGWQGYREHQWDEFLVELQGLPGVTVTQLEKGWGNRHVRGIIDPKVGNLHALAKSYGFDKGEVSFAFSPVFYASQQFEKERSEAEKLRLEKVYASLTESQLNQSKVLIDQAIGEYDSQRIEESLRKYRLLHDLPSSVTTHLQEGVLTLSGKLHEPAYSSAIRMGKLVESVKEVKADGLTNQTAAEILKLQKEISKLKIPFRSGTDVPVEKTASMIEEVASSYRQIEKLALLSGHQVALQLRAIPLVGDYPDENRAVVTKRADYLNQVFQERGLRIDTLDWDPEPEEISSSHNGLYVVVNVQKNPVSH